jgi:hypothetical protein
MMDEFVKMLKKKMEEQGGPKHGPEMKAKACMSKACSDSLADDLLGGVQKVTVASDSKQGLKKGLEKAEEVIESEDREEDSEESEESEKDENKEDSEDPESLKLEIAKLKSEIEDLKKRA